MHVFVDEADREPLLASLERIAELPIERVIVPHCETPIFVDGAARIRAAVAEARQRQGLRLRLHTAVRRHARARLRSTIRDVQHTEVTG